jgi:thiol-disulfide isomerase/thioredoxin
MKAAWGLIATVLLCAPVAQADALRPFHRGSWQAVLHEHQGKPMMVHFWGLTCGPCLVELPAWGRLAHEHPDLNLVTIAADPSPMPPNSLSATLDKAGLSQAENWMFDSMSERLPWEVDPNWEGELPLTILIAADGTTRTMLGAADMNAVTAWLAAQSPQARPPVPDADPTARSGPPR